MRAQRATMSRKRISWRSGRRASSIATNMAGRDRHPARRQSRFRMRDEHVELEPGTPNMPPPRNGSSGDRREKERVFEVVPFVLGTSGMKAGAFDNQLRGRRAAGIRPEPLL